MEIRKFIVELHPDGKMTWCKYLEPDPYGFMSGGRTAVEKIIGIIDNRKQIQQNLARQHIANGKMETAKVATTSALEDDMCIRLIKEQFSMY